MTTPEVDPDYLAIAIDAFVAAVAEASAIISTGDAGDVPELFRYANDLLDIVGDGIAASPEALGCLDRLREMVSAMWNAVDGARSLH